MGSIAVDNLTPLQERAIVALLNEPTVLKAALAVGVGERTIHSWLDDPAFSAAFRRARREVFGQAVSLSGRYASMAIHTLAQIMTDKTAPTSARVSAASAMLRFARESIEIEDLSARVALLEQSTAGDDQVPQAA